MSLTVVIGGTRSGKSARAEALAAASGLPVRYVGTADATDMAERVAAHVARRPASWETVEADGSLAAALADADGVCVLVDGLGTWIAGRMHHGATAETIRAEVASATDALAVAGAAIVVAEQAGEGLLPADALSRTWLDLLGEATQALAARADRVEVVVAGHVCASMSNWSTPMHTRPPEEDGLRSHGDRLVRPGDADHAVNVVAGGPPPWLRDALADVDVSRYPDETAAVEALAALHRRAPEEIVPTNGAAEALWLLGPAVRPRLAACVHPGFTESEAALRAHGVPVTRVLRDPAEDFALDPAKVPDDADLVIVGNPANPSGTLDPATAILALRRPDRAIVVDEAFMDLTPGEPGSLASEQLDDVIVIRSLTKALGIPGLRAGYAIAPPPLAALLRAVRPPWSANSMALAALQAAAAHPTQVADIAERAAAERADLAERLTAAGIRVWPGTANFVLIEVSDGDALAAALRTERIAVRPAASFPGLDTRHVRVTARDPEANAKLANAIARHL